MDEYDAMQVEQKNLCAICNEPETRMGAGRAKHVPLILAVDHCHTSGKVRGLLCKRCNQGIGAFEDRPDLLRSAANYLEAASVRNR